MQNREDFAVKNLKFSYFSFSDETHYPTGKLFDSHPAATRVANGELLPVRIRQGQPAGALTVEIEHPDILALVDTDDDLFTLHALKAGTTTLEGAMNPFSSGETRVASTSELESATATFAASLPSDGTYGVHVAWSAGPDRASPVPPRPQPRPPPQQLYCWPAME